jgi:hypothetical protein
MNTAWDRRQQLVWRTLPPGAPPSFALDEPQHLISDQQDAGPVLEACLP